jgi:hypothetical protein
MTANNQVLPKSEKNHYDIQSMFFFLHLPNMERTTGLEPATPCLEGKRSTN